MAHKKKGQLTVYIEWSKHLKKIGKRIFRKGERQAEKKLIEDQLSNYEV